MQLVGNRFEETSMIRKNGTGDYQSERSSARSLLFRGIKLVTLFLLAGTLLAAIHTRPNSAKSPADSKDAITVRAAGHGKGLLNPRDGRALNAEYADETSVSQVLRAGSAQPLTLASGDFDGDGAPDLITGYKSSGGGILTLQRGNVDAFAPRDLQIYDRAARGELPPSFLDDVQTIELPEAPNFLLAGDFDHDGHQDLLTAARGGGLYFLSGDGHSGFQAPQQLALSGQVTALVTGNFSHAEGLQAVIASVVGPEGSALAIFNEVGSGLSRIP